MAADRVPRSFSVLVVDDSAVDRKLAENVLERAGYAVSTASGGSAALSMLRDAVPDCILMDVSMPGMNGFELLAAVKARAHLREVPIVMMSSDSGEARIVRSIELGAADFVLKPLTPAVLRSRIESVLRVHGGGAARLPPAGAGETGELLRVLAVDDSVTALRVLHRTLAKRGYAVTMADSGEAALRAMTAASNRGVEVATADAASATDDASSVTSTPGASATPFDVILLDIIMPGMSGKDVIRAVKRGPPAWRSVPIIVMSSLDDPDTANECLQLGAHDVLSKPFNVEIVVTRINACVEWLRLRSWVASKLTAMSSSVPAPALEAGEAAAEPKSARETYPAVEAATTVTRTASPRDQSALGSTHVTTLEAQPERPKSGGSIVSGGSTPPGNDIVRDTAPAVPTSSAWASSSPLADSLQGAWQADDSILPAMLAPMAIEPSLTFRAPFTAQPPRPTAAAAPAPAEPYMSDIDRLLATGAMAARSLQQSFNPLEIGGASGLRMPMAHMPPLPLPTHSSYEALSAQIRQLQAEKAELQEALRLEQVDVRARLEGQMKDLQRTLRAVTQDNRLLKKQVTSLFDHEQQLLSALRGARNRVQHLYEEAAVRGYVPSLPLRSSPYAALLPSPPPPSPRPAAGYVLELEVEQHEEAVILKALALFETEGSPTAASRGTLHLHVMPPEAVVNEYASVTHARKSKLITRVLPPGGLRAGSTEFAVLVTEVCGFPAYFRDLLHARIKEDNALLADAADVTNEDPDADSRVYADEFIRSWAVRPPGSRRAVIIPSFDRVARFWKLVCRRGEEYVTASDLRPLVEALLDFHPDLARLRGDAQARVCYQLVVLTSLFCSLHGQRNMRVAYPELRASNLVAAFHVVAAQTTRHVLPFALTFYHDVMVQWRQLTTSLPATDFTHDITDAPLRAEYVHCCKSDLCCTAEGHLARMGYISAAHLATWGECAMNPWIVKRILSGRPRPLHCPRAGHMDFLDFIWLFLACRDRMSDSSLFYWFRALDADDDGALSAADLLHVLSQRSSSAQPVVTFSVQDDTPAASAGGASAAPLTPTRASRGTPPPLEMPFLLTTAADDDPDSAQSGSSPRMPVRAQVPARRHSGSGTPPVASTQHAGMVGQQRHAPAAMEGITHLRPASREDAAADAAHEHTPGSPRPYDPELDTACKPLTSLAVSTLPEDYTPSTGMHAPAAASAPVGRRNALPTASAASVRGRDTILADALHGLIDFINPARARITALDIKRADAGPALFDVLISMADVGAGVTTHASSPGGGGAPAGLKLAGL